MAQKITAALVKQLREMTDSPMMECKKALVETDGDIEAAVDVLRTRGLAAAAKKAGRETNEGTVGAYVSEDGTKGALVEVRCETDFVGTNPKFTGFAREVAAIVAEQNPSTTEELLALPMNGTTVQEELTELIHIIKENMKLGRFARREGNAISSYVHLGGKIGVLTEFAVGKADTAASDTFKSFAHDVAMQGAAGAPAVAICATRDQVPAEVVEHEKAIYKEQAAQSGKPENIQEKMAQGRLEKFYKQTVLCEQEFIKDSSMTISDYIEKTAKELDDQISVVGFERFVLGEE